MNGHLDPFNEDAREIMAAIVARLTALRALIDDRTVATEQKIGEYMRDLAKRIEEGRSAYQAARAELARSANPVTSEPADQIAEWKRTCDTMRLHARADRLERSAAAAMYLAATATEEAALACLIALLARKEAIAAQVRWADEL